MFHGFRHGVLVKTRAAEKKSAGGILLPSTAQTKPQDWCPVVYSKYAGSEVEFNGSHHLILKEDDIVGILETEDVTDLKPIDDKVPIKGEEAEETTAGGLLLTQASK
uniref:Co-chaperone GroES n=1 Tax=Lactuca sativa TaxID=4236 RepID=A0A9R1VNB4_LACSA|nr:hypothetical protein LSAT_V11C400207850 [Lactuca sativa]